MRALLQKFDAADCGLLLLAGGVAWHDVGFGMIVLGGVLVLQARPLKSWWG